MDFNFKCHRCGTRNRTTAQAIGTMVRCVECGIELEVPLTAFSSGMVEGEYWVHQKVGTGSVSEVYVTKLLSTANGDDEDANKVYMKVMSPLATVDKLATERFFGNLLQSRRIDHPNVLSVVDTGIMKGHCFFTTAYIEGECLDAKIERDGPLSEPEALKVCLRVAKLMKQVWNDHRFVHQALKPNNILVNKEGEVFLLDLGNSKQCLVPADGHLEAINPKGNLFDYMSPEQIQNLPDLDPTSDIYSLGASLHFMICGEKPYTDTMTSSIAQKHLWSPPPQLEAHDTKVSKQTADLVRWMMSGRSEGGHRTWEELIKGLSVILKKQKGSKTGRSHNRPKIKPTAYSKTRPKPESEPEDTPPAKTSKNTAMVMTVTALVLFLGMILGGVFLLANQGGGEPVVKRLDNSVLNSRLTLAREKGHGTASTIDGYIRDLKALSSRTDDKIQLNELNDAISELMVAKRAAIAKNASTVIRGK